MDKRKFKIVRAITFIKLHHGATKFENVRQRQYPEYFRSKCQFEIVEENETTIIPEERQFSQEDAEDSTSFWKSDNKKPNFG